MYFNRIIVSACLCGGGPWRYDGRDKSIEDPRFRRWLQEGRLLPICPEVAGGLSVPRPRSEILENEVINELGEKVTENYRSGAEEAVRLALQNDIHIAILKEKSPACGSKTIYDGSFSGNLIPGMGVAAQALDEAGVMIFDESEIEIVAALLGDDLEENE